jgi:hypothetical protein
VKTIFGAKCNHFAAMPPVTNATTNAMPWLEVDDELLPKQQQMTAANLGNELLPKQKQMTAANLGKRKADGICERKAASKSPCYKCPWLHQRSKPREHGMEL